MNGQSEHFYHYLKSLEKRRDLRIRCYLWTGLSQEIGDEDFILVWQVQTTMQGIKIANECIKVRLESYSSQKAYQEGEFISFPIEIYTEFIKPYFQKNRVQIHMMG
jgi:hypothetical protein